MENRAPRSRRLFWVASLLLAQVSLLLLVIAWRFFTSLPVKMQLHTWYQPFIQRSHATSSYLLNSRQVEQVTTFDWDNATVIGSPTNEALEQEVLPYDSRANRGNAVRSSSHLERTSPSGLEHLDSVQDQTRLENKRLYQSLEGDWIEELVRDTEATHISPYPEGALVIPTLELEVELTQVPLHDGKWDITDLDSRVGWLQSTGSHPGDHLAMTFIGHGTLPPPGGAGPFMRLHRLKLGDEIQYRTADTIYIYRVESRKSIAPTDVDRLYQADGERMILITCTAWNPLIQKYERRLLVEANLVNTAKP